MSKFRKKPVVIDAITFDELVLHGVGHGPVFHFVTHEIPEDGEPIEHVWSIIRESGDCFLIPTLEGSMMMKRDDMLITGVKGEIYPCKREIFNATYEAVG